MLKKRAKAFLINSSIDLHLLASFFYFIKIENSIKFQFLFNWYGN